jgi:predicted ATPase
MTQFITSVEVNLVEGKFKKIVHFNSGFNIISGENGTLKTKLIQAIRSSNVIKSNPHPGSKSSNEAIVNVENQGKELNAIFISPKRNSEKRSIEAIFEKLRNQMPHMTADMSPFIQFEDNNYKTYPSFGELFYKSFSDKNKLGGDQIACMNEVLYDFNLVISKIFHDYKLIADWSVELGRPEIKLDKGNRGIVPLESISLGEQEILSLVLNLYDNRNSCDTIFIDEPETHLNWHLEEKLFNYFFDFSKSFCKQIIIVTHSRIIFREMFLKQTQFLYWTESGEIEVSSKPNDKVKTILAGEIPEIIKLGNFDRLTFFVEDSAHELIIATLSNKFGVEVNCIKCGNSQNVKTLFKQSKIIGEWGSAIFLVDGDNQGNEFPGERNFIHLDNYCLENYFLNKSVLSKLLNKTEEEVIEIIIEIIKKRKQEILKNFVSFDFLLDRIVSTDVEEIFLSKIDASKILPLVIKKTGLKDKEEFYSEYMSTALELRILSEVLPNDLVSLFEQK